MVGLSLFTFSIGTTLWHLWPCVQYFHEFVRVGPRSLRIVRQTFGTRPTFKISGRVTIHQVGIEGLFSSTKRNQKPWFQKKSTPGTTHQPRQTQCTLIDDTYREKNEANPLDNSMPEKMVKAVSPVELSKLKFMDEASHDSWLMQHMPR